MSEKEGDFLAEIARKVAASDAQADAAIADILAGRTHHRRTTRSKPESTSANPPAPAKKPRARRSSKPKA